MNAIAVGKILDNIVKYAPALVTTAEVIYKNIIDYIKNRRNSTNKNEPISLDNLNEKYEQLEQNTLE